MQCGNRPRTTGLHSAIPSSEQNWRIIRPRSSLPHTCSRRSRCPTYASHSSRPTVGLGACGLELPAACPGEVILQIREKNRGKESRPQESARHDKWSFCLTAATLCFANQG